MRGRVDRPTAGANPETVDADRDERRDLLRRTPVRNCPPGPLDLPRGGPYDGLMGRLIYSMLTSLDGFCTDSSGGYDWERAADAELHDAVVEHTGSVETYLFGRRMYEVMTFWETALDLPDLPDHVRRYATSWQAASKVVYSETLAAPVTRRTTLERSFDPEAVRAFVDSQDSDVSIEGPTLAAHALRAGIVDEIQPYVVPVAVGGGSRFLPEGLELDLDLLEERRLSSGTLWLRYSVRRD